LAPTKVEGVESEMPFGQEGGGGGNGTGDDDDDDVLAQVPSPGTIVTPSIAPSMTRVPSFGPTITQVPSFRPTKKGRMSRNPSRTRNPAHTRNPARGGGTNSTDDDASKEINSASPSTTMSTAATVGVAMGATAIVLFAVAAAKMRRNGNRNGYYWGHSVGNSSSVMSPDDPLMVLGPNDTVSGDEDGHVGGGAGDGGDALMGEYGTPEPRTIMETAPLTSGTPRSSLTPPPWRSEPRDDDGSPALPPYHHNSDHGV
jgi:hypothetical protein